MMNNRVMALFLYLDHPLETNCICCECIVLPNNDKEISRSHKHISSIILRLDKLCEEIA